MTTDRTTTPPATEPIPQRGWSRGILCLSGAVVVPPTEAGAPTGVLSAGQDVPEAATWREGRRQSPPVTPEQAENPFPLPGRHLWGGMIFGHFGHFLVETLSRLWALGDEPFESIIFTARGPALRDIVGYRREMFDLLGLAAPIRVVETPCRVEELVVPGQGFGLGAISAGTPEFRGMIRRMAKGILPEGPERIYLSRTQFGGRGGILDETCLEENLAAQGYTALHPQRMSLRDQIAAYKAATHVVGADGSAFHMLGFAGRRDQKVAIIRRRDHEAYTHIVTQLKAFAGHAPVVFDRLAAEWMPENQTISNHLSWGELDIRALGRDLAEAGFLDSPDAWTVPDPWPTAEGLARATETSGRRLVRRPLAGATPVPAPALGPSSGPTVLGLCRFSMLGRGDWKAYRKQPDHKLDKIIEDTAQELFAAERMERRLATFEHLTLRSMQAQSDGDFHFLVVSSDRMPEHYKERLRRLCDPVAQVSLRFVEPMHITQAQKDAVADLRLRHPDCLQFRLDDDDCVSRDFIRRARRHGTQLWDNNNFAMSFAQQYYCVTDGPTSGVYNWFSPFFSAGAFLRHRNKSVFDFGHYRLQSRFFSVLEPHFPNLVTHDGTNDTPRHAPEILKKRGMKRASAAEITRVLERHFDYLTEEGLRLTTLDRFRSGDEAG